MGLMLGLEIQSSAVAALEVGQGEGLMNTDYVYVLEYIIRQERYQLWQLIFPRPSTYVLLAFSGPSLLILGRQDHLRSTVYPRTLIESVSQSTWISSTSQVV